MSECGNINTHYTHVCIYMYVCMYEYMYICMYVYTCILYQCIQLAMYIGRCTWVCIKADIYIYIYIHILEIHMYVCMYIVFPELLCYVLAVDFLHIFLKQICMFFSSYLIKLCSIRWWEDTGSVCREYFDSFKVLLGFYWKYKVIIGKYVHTHTCSCTWNRWVIPRNI